MCLCANAKRIAFEKARSPALPARLARQALVEHGRVVGEDRRDDGHLHDVGRGHAIVEVHVGVMGAGVVLQAVLHELEGGQAQIVEGDVVGAPRRAAADRGRAEIRQLRQLQ